jgi:hypothetical protein
VPRGLGELGDAMVSMLPQGPPVHRLSCRRRARSAASSGLRRGPDRHQRRRRRGRRRRRHLRRPLPRARLLRGCLGACSPRTTGLAEVIIRQQFVKLFRPTELYSFFLLWSFQVVEHNIGSSSIAFVYLEDLLIHFRLFGLLLILKQFLALLKQS